MRRANKVALLTMGSALLITSGAAMAGAPTAYGQYSVTNGTITYTPTTPSATDPTCPSGFSCGAAITGNGFFQRQVTATDGSKYFQTIIVPTNASTSTAVPLSSLAFSDENFVKQAGGTGIADQQNVFASATTANPGDFTSNVQINSGWAQDTSNANPALWENAIDLHQNLTDVGSDPGQHTATNPKFNLDFTLTDNSTNNSAPVVGLNEAVSLYTSTNPNSAPDDKQVFVLKQLKATSAGSVNLTGATDQSGNGVLVPATSTTPSVGTVSWDQGNLIQAMWMGQVVTSGTGGTQAFGVQTYTNVDGTNANAGSVTLVDQGRVGPVTFTSTTNTAGDTLNGSPGAQSVDTTYWWDDSVFSATAGTAPSMVITGP